MIRLYRRRLSAISLINCRRLISSDTAGRLDLVSYDFLKESKKLEKPLEPSNVLPFAPRRHSETFAQLVRGDHYKCPDAQNSQPDIESSPFRNPDGSYIKGNNAEEARLHDDTLEGRVDRHVTKLPTDIAKAINNNILGRLPPDRLRERVALLYQSLSKDQIQKAPESALDCDAHIAALFLQNYSHARQTLLELRKRVGEDRFDPRKVLDISYGPATGMVALNEIMGPKWAPDEKDAYIIGRRNNEMKKRAKVILSRQLNEHFTRLEDHETEHSNELVPGMEPAESATENNAEENTEEDVDNNGEHVGPIRSSAIKTYTRLRDSLPSTKKYDLIIVNQCMLTREFNFPKDIDTNLYTILRLLAPGGHLILVERGNTLGFETIARARQVMLRPESHENEKGKIPRPYLKGSSVKPRALRKEDQIVSETDIAFEEELLAKMSKPTGEEPVDATLATEFERELNAQYGEPLEEELKFEGEDEGEFEVLPVLSATHEVSKDLETNSNSIDFHISILAPCAHHGKCPLQLGDPKFYNIPSHKHRFSHCSFSKVVERPKYTMELKKGRRLATSWDKTAADGFGLDTMNRGDLKKLQGLGRPGGHNTESGSFSYLIAERSLSDPETIAKIEELRRLNDGYVRGNSSDLWPRVTGAPAKVKNNVRLEVCAPSGKIETWQVPKSLGKQTYHDARKVDRGDLWALGCKSATPRKTVSTETRQKLDVLHKTQTKRFLKEQRRKSWKKLTSASVHDFDKDFLSISDDMASSLENTMAYKKQAKKANFDVDPSQFDGK